VYFPTINRRSVYKLTRKNTYYADYKIYYEEIAEDCQYRCVYCDVLLDEIGGEGMHLDHFKPQQHFPNLANSPLNLVLACAKCNQLKSDWWPEVTGNANGGQNGFVDPFDANRNSYFEVGVLGEIVPKLPPSQYFIELLSLNRMNRIITRRKRAIISRAHIALARIQQELENISQLPASELQAKLPDLIQALGGVRKLLAT
jgi:hypothetical protein